MDGKRGMIKGGERGGLWWVKGGEKGECYRWEKREGYGWEKVED